MFELLIPLLFLKKTQGLVYRYDVSKSADGVGGEEGTFSLCTLWYVILYPLSAFDCYKFNACAKYTI